MTEGRIMSGFKRGTRYAILICSLAVGGHVEAAGDAARGAKVFQACTACHSVKAGAVEDFLRYSDAMKKSSVAWNGATLDKWLANPQRFLPGTSMGFAGIREAKDRQDVIAYLQSVAEGKAPAGARQGMMGRKPDLKKAPPEGQVTAIEHCRDTYTVKTADGKVDKVWEFNLRFKTDSGKDGPAPGKPVIVGAGMQGDRASIVFASASEISNFIKSSCP